MTAPRSETVNPATGFTHSEMNEFVRSHFEEFVNRKHIAISKINFAREFVDRGSDVPPELPPGPDGAMQYVGGAIRKFPDLHVTIEDIVAEEDKVVVRNTWRATNPQNGAKLKFSGIVI